MIINIRGTSGSGKTTVVRKLLNIARPACPYHDGSPSEKIEGYYCGGLAPVTTAIIGSYAKPTGGSDGIKPLSRVFEQVKWQHDNGLHVVFEGLLVSRSKGRIIDLWEAMHRKNFYILHLTTPFETCLEGIRERRLARKNTKPVDPQRTRETYERAAKITRDLEALGMPVKYVTRDEALQKVQDCLNHKW